MEITRGKWSADKVQGAASTLPPSQVSSLLYDVARELERDGAGMTEVAVGYYMAVLADPKGKRHADAFERLGEIILDEDLPHEDAVRIYNGGLSTLRSLHALNIGLPHNGLAIATRELHRLKTAYHAHRAMEAAPDR